MTSSNTINRIFVLIIVLLTVSSCVTRKNMVYFQNVDQLRESVERNRNDNLQIQPDDELTIRVSAPEQEATIPFNLTKSVASEAGVGGSVELETYLVSSEGTIQFPVIGVMEVQGLTTTELAEKIRKSILEYVKDPIINVRILNFQISVLGEVNSPGTFSIDDDHINLSKAIAMAGDLTIFGKRDNILILGEEEGVKTYAYLDLTDANVVNSPYYNLRQNDVIYVEPRSSRRQAAGSTNIAATYISIASVIASLVVLFTK
ncbi:polysaccharide biosynthesis/export family protein [Salinimicrobium sp. TH3]|uniref:polysaccharide biosynthesis/export family protein n=1 Tax=Salinimicrobium sp. TH3 TaxID=2997342 RepID=UPI002276CD07|nr:polysaccharide biosynthesis/export family protein [Salinimicrobium sp. TH3]MCY2687554.1 polysaccharide biosynthesis/export family protein [Salinimicrobium sp. TH3]